MLFSIFDLISGKGKEDSLIFQIIPIFASDNHQKQLPMKKRYTLILLLLIVATAVKAQIQQFEWQNTQREYLVKVPTQHDETMPVLYFLHGLGDNITRLDNEFHFQQIANRFGWMVVIPQALPQSGATMWNAALMSSSIDDSGFLMALLDTLAVQYPINLDSVFFTGFSMGGFMTHRMAIEHGDRITACAPVSGLITHAMASHTAVAPVKMLHIHGTADPVVGYDGNSQYFGGNLGLGVDAILNYWKNANHCEGDPVIDTLPDLHNDGLRFVRYTYGCDAELQHIKVIGGNHTWYHNESQYDIGYMTEIHRFFTTGVSVGAAETAQGGWHVWPNPTSGQVTIEAEADTDLTVFDLLGRVTATHPLRKGTNSLDLSDLPEGMYFIKTSEGMVRKVLVKE